MIILDENIPSGQRQTLRSWRIHARQIGIDVGRPGMSDQEIAPLLQQLQQPTFFTRDAGFYSRRLCCSDYCVVHLVISQYEVASFVRRVLRHPALRTKRHRMGTVLRVSHAGLRLWRLHGELEEVVPWAV